MKAPTEACCPSRARALVSHRLDWLGHAVSSQTLSKCTDSLLYLLPTLPVGRAVDSAVFNFALAQGVVEQIGRSPLVSSSAFVDNARNHHSQPGQTASHHGTRRPCKDRDRALLVVRKTFAQAPPASVPDHTVFPRRQSGACDAIACASDHVID